jgi:hypothetical protein
MARKIGSLVVMGLGPAVMAGVLAAVVHTELGVSPWVVRRTALVCFGLLVIGLYSDRFGGRK